MTHLSNYSEVGIPRSGHAGVRSSSKLVLIGGQGRRGASRAGGRSRQALVQLHLQLPTAGRMLRAMDYEHRVVPFLGDVRSRDKDSADKVAKQLQAVIDSNAVGGWEFYRIDQVQIAVQPGCLAGILGAKVTMIGLDQITFRRAKS